MNLTKAQIDIIDNYLKDKGIGYWDIRLEMVDHIACKMEEKQGSFDFESLFADTVAQLGWTGNLKDYECRKLKSINTTIRKKYFLNFIRLFTKVNNLCYVLLFLIGYYLAFKNLPPKIFNIFSLMLFALPIVYFTIHYAYTTIMYKKSGYLFYGYFYIIFSVLMLNLLYQFPRPGGVFEVSEVTRQYIVFLATILNVLFICSGIKVYLQTSKTYQNLYQQLHSNLKS